MVIARLAPGEAGAAGAVLCANEVAAVQGRVRAMSAVSAVAAIARRDITRGGVTVGP